LYGYSNPLPNNLARYTAVTPLYQKRQQQK
jgi:hypothetical protein